ncbi:tyrosine-type recombinase/integrase [Oscillospiraceae bacterium LTW-04]|nr:tyrosine-type recombinase/integrase [Oscillospiraceae bacterium MB24-C1]
MKEQLTREIINAALVFLETPQIEQLQQCITIALHSYEISLAETAMVPVESLTERVFKTFFVSKKIEGLSEKSLKYYAMEIKALIEFIQKPLDQIGTDDIRFYLVKQSQKGISKVTLDNKRRVFNSFFSWAYNEDYIEKNPMRKIKKIKTEKIIKQPFTEEQVEVLRGACRTLRETAMVELFASTGMRVGEMETLEISRIDFLTGEVIVYGKGAKERVTYLNARAKLHLMRYLKSRQDDCPAVIVREKGEVKGLSISRIEKIIKAIGERAGVENTHPHRFRRTTATTAIGRGMPIEQVQQMLGHTSIETTTRYAVVSQKNVKASHERYLAG